MKIDYSKVISKEYFTNIDKEKLEYLKKEGEKYFRQFDRSNDNRLLRTKRAKCIARKHTIFNEEERQILASNIALNDRKVIEALLNKDINYNILYYYSTLISKFKKLVSLTDNLNITDEIIVANKKINYICSIIRLYFGVDDFTLIATKLNEIVATQKDLYREMEKARVK